MLKTQFDFGGLGHKVRACVDHFIAGSRSSVLSFLLLPDYFVGGKSLCPASSVVTKYFFKIIFTSKVLRYAVASLTSQAYRFDCVTFAMMCCSLSCPIDNDG